MVRDVNLKDLLGSADNLTAFMVASVLLWRTFREWYLRTLGAKRKLRHNLDTLACGNPVAYVDQLFGEPAFVDYSKAVVRYGREEGEKEERVDLRVYSTKYGWLTVHLLDGIVAAYAFTLTSDKFRYDLAVQSCGRLRGVLGRTVVARIGDGEGFPESGEYFVGASTYGYTEVWYFGRPAMYQSYGLSVTMAGWRHGPSPDWSLPSVTWGRYASDAAPALEAGDLGSFDPRVEQLRSSVAPDTFSVFAFDFRYEIYDDIHASGAIDHDRLRLLTRREFFGKKSAVQRGYFRLCRTVF